MIELIVVMSIIGILARIALPASRAMIRRATAARVVGDFNAVRIAAFNFYADSSKWPVEAAAGKIPAGLANYLRAKFSFAPKGYQLDWENWTSGAKYTKPATGVAVGISVVTTDAELGNAVVKLLGSGAGIHWTVGTSYTFVIQSTGGTGF